ncbi:MAG: hypothetical protein ACTHLE_15230 [Agriterribacter sp.]
MKKTILILVVISFPAILFAQKVDSIYFNLYTDSLKKGTYNYINVEGKLSDGKIRPLDSSQLVFASSYGKFSGNSLWLPFETKEEKINITVKNRQNPSQVIYRTIFIKKKTDDGPLKTVDEIMANPGRKNKKRRE